MTITATVIADSITLDSTYDRITTMQLRYPRLIHAEFMTHRAFSRNASSSRAIPVERLIQDVLDDTAMPVSWGKNKKGMQAGKEHDAPVVFDWAVEEADVMSAEEAWIYARDAAIHTARAYAKAGYHKQVCNRLLEPFAHINVVVTATEWFNFFDLRLDAGADPTIQALARAMWDARDRSVPKNIAAGDWHLPYLDPAYRAEGWRSLGHIMDARRISAARCGRVSYLTHDGRPSTPDEDIRLSFQLSSSGHWSPFEHQARPLPGKHANLTGWISHRTEIGQ